MGISRLDIYRSPNIGVFVKANDNFILVPAGLAPTKSQRLSSLLKAEPVQVSLGGSRLIGPLLAMNNKGLIVPRIVEEHEFRQISRATGMNIGMLASKHTCVGNLVVANDRGGIASTILARDAVKQISEVLDVHISQVDMDHYVQVGSMLVATNSGAAISPLASEEQARLASKVLGVHVESVTVNGGVPFVSSGMVANSTNAIVGSLTTGPELMMISRAFAI